MKRLTEHRDNGVILVDVSKQKESAVHRLAAIEDILGDEYGLDELREMVQAKRKGRCIVLPCKKGDTVWRIVHDAAPHITKDRCTDIKYENRDIWVHLIGDRVMGGWNFGKLLFLTREEAQAALRREQKWCHLQYARAQDRGVHPGRRRGGGGQVQKLQIFQR